VSGAPIYFENKTRRMHHWYRNIQSLRSLPLKKVGRRSQSELTPDGKPAGCGSNLISSHFLTYTKAD